MKKTNTTEDGMTYPDTPSKKTGMFRHYIKAFRLALVQESGITLIDLSLALMIAGLMVAPLTQQYLVWKKNQEQDIANGTIALMEEALRRYYFEHGYYPCPARPGVGPETVITPPEAPRFGIENRKYETPDLTDVEKCAHPPGPEPEFISGMIPFKTLKLDNNEVLDPWGNKLRYVVTYALTHEDTFKDALGVPLPGALTISKPEAMQPHATSGKDVCQLNAFPTTTGIHAVILSHGKDGNGAYNNSGTYKACDANNLDSENCNDDEVFLFPECQFSEESGSAHYDDHMYDTYGVNGVWTSIPRSLWEPGEDKSNLGSEAGYFGIGNDDPQHPIDVIGNIQAVQAAAADDPDRKKSGNALAAQYCNSDGQNCFQPERITGDSEEMNCASGAMSGLGSNKAKCVQSITGLKPITCPSGKFVTGVDAEGNMICGN